MLFLPKIQNEATYLYRWKMVQGQSAFISWIFLVVPSAPCAVHNDRPSAKNTGSTRRPRCASDTILCVGYLCKHVHTRLRICMRVCVLLPCTLEVPQYICDFERHASRPSMYSRRTHLPLPHINRGVCAQFCRACVCVLFRARYERWTVISVPTILDFESRITCRQPGPNANAALRHVNRSACVRMWEFPLIYA